MPSSTATAPPPSVIPRTRWITVLGVVAVVLVGLNLRAGITSAAALFHDLQAVLGYGPLVAAILPSIPTVTFAFAGAATAWLVRRIGVERTILLALVILAAGLAIRAIPSVGMLLVGTVAGMCGIALCNVAMPSFIREHYAHRTSTLTGTYTITMSLGATAASALGVPLARQLGSPSLGLAAWSILAAVSVLVFIPLAIAGRPRPRPRQDAALPVAPAEPGGSLLAVLRTRQGLLITGFFTVQALLVYSLISWLPVILISRGMDPSAAGIMLGLMQLVTIPATVVLLAMATRPHLLRSAFMVCCIGILLGLSCLILLPVGFSVLSVVLLGLGLTIFPLLLVVISRSGRNAVETTAISTVAQSVGYLVASAGPFGLALLHTLAGGWTAPLWVLFVVAVIQLLLAWALTSDRPAGPAGQARRRRKREVPA
ncbi:MFS transporter [Arthrobacter rhombi]|uniref:MFS transporter n=1 Tax=Micrococcaceae TaxID=1268 RepID=UPI000BB98733|nr:MFS transporter [Glutamicibacter sp. BW78]PCC24323.1 MFS transporter [Glutamicibacter sp. BW78]